MGSASIPVIVQEWSVVARMKSTVGETTARIPVDWRTKSATMAYVSDASARTGSGMSRENVFQWKSAPRHARKCVPWLVLKACSTTGVVIVAIILATTVSVWISAFQDVIARGGGTCQLAESVLTRRSTVAPFGWSWLKQSRTAGWSDSSYTHLRILKKKNLFTNCNWTIFN